MRTGAMLLAMAGMGLALPVAVTAQQMAKSDIRAAPSRPYTFRHSRLKIPATLEGMPRTGIAQIGTDELDVYARYERGSDLVTVYVYRNVGGSVPVWFDRARASILSRSAEYGTVTPALAPVAFTPPGQSTASGLMGAWSISRPPYRGTGLALLPMGEWWVKVRYSSITLDGAGVAARLPAVLAALTWPKAVPPAPAAAPVADCAQPLRYPTTAEPVRDQQALSTATVASGLLASASARLGRTPNPAVWCRDPGAIAVGAAYRANGSTDSYLLAFSDSGRGILVAPDGLLNEVSGAGDGADDTPRNWTVALLDTGATTNFVPMTALPRPDQVLAAAEGPVLSRTSTWGRKIEVTINPDFLK